MLSYQLRSLLQTEYSFVAHYVLGQELVNLGVVNEADIRLDLFHPFRWFLGGKGGELRAGT